jgi:hypothetical protein
MLELTQNNCVICLENADIFNPLTHKASHFGCNCLIYFHDICWSTFLETDNKCPYCRLIAPITPQRATLYSFVQKYSIFLLFSQILISPACVLYTIGIVDINPTDTHFSEIVIVVSTVYLDFLLTFIVDCNTSLLRYNFLRKLYIVFNFFKIVILVFSIIIVTIGHLNDHKYILYGTTFYVVGYFIVAAVLGVTLYNTN